MLSIFCTRRFCSDLATLCFTCSSTGMFGSYGRGCDRSCPSIEVNLASAAASTTTSCLPRLSRSIYSLRLQPNILPLHDPLVNCLRQPLADEILAVAVSFRSGAFKLTGNVWAGTPCRSPGTRSSKPCTRVPLLCPSSTPCRRVLRAGGACRCCCSWLSWRRRKRGAGNGT